MVPPNFAVTAKSVAQVQFSLPMTPPKLKEKEFKMQKLEDLILVWGWQTIVNNECETEGYVNYDSMLNRCNPGKSFDSIDSNLAAQGGEGKYSRTPPFLYAVANCIPKQTH